MQTNMQTNTNIDASDAVVIKTCALWCTEANNWERPEPKSPRAHATQKECDEWYGFWKLVEASLTDLMVRGREGCVDGHDTRDISDWIEDTLRDGQLFNAEVRRQAKEYVRTEEGRAFAYYIGRIACLDAQIDSLCREA